MNGVFEGDLIRPLGLVTMNFGYAEYELDSFLERLVLAGLLPDSWAQRPIGQKLNLLKQAIHPLAPSVQTRLDELLQQVQGLLDRRNTLIHGCLIAGGRVVSARSGVAEKHTSVEELNSLADEAFTWKEQLWSYRWRQIEPLLSNESPHTTADTSFERTRGR